jgi:uncharacterized protein
MNLPEIALHHQRLDQRAGQLRSQIERVRAELATDHVAERLEQEAAATATARRELDHGLREREREAEDRRARVRGRQRELMSGRIRNPTELTALSTEVQHMKERLSVEEDAELELMEEVEGRDQTVRRAELEAQQIQAESEASAPELRQQLEKARLDLVAADTERVAVWSEIPPGYRSAYERIRVRPPVAEVNGTSCSACRVGVTTGGLQQLRRGELVRCENCGRILVMG